MTHSWPNIIVAFKSKGIAWILFQTFVFCHCSSKSNISGVFIEICLFIWFYLFICFTNTVTQTQSTNMVFLFGRTKIGLKIDEWCGNKKTGAIKPKNRRTICHKRQPFLLLLEIFFPIKGCGKLMQLRKSHEKKWIYSRIFGEYLKFTF